MKGSVVIISVGVNIVIVVIDRMYVRLCDGSGDAIDVTELLLLHIIL